MKRTKKSPKTSDETSVQIQAQEIAKVEAAAPLAVEQAPKVETKVIEEKPITKPTPSIKSTDQDGVWVRLSSSLKKKLLEQAQEEGISFEEYVAELLAESVVLRAWEIAEKKAHMRGPTGPSMPSNNNSHHRNGNNNHHNNHNRNHGKMGGNNSNNNHSGGGQNRRNLNQQRYNNLMEDKAAFLEYVRNQERNQR